MTRDGKSASQPPPAGRFTHANEGFRCDVCGAEVPPLPGSCRNHCPRCLSSKHVDVNPGDRAHPCQGTMDAVDYELGGKKGLMLVFQCRKCGARGRNFAAHEAKVAPDDYEKILALKKTAPRQP